ncbi:MAG: alpha/beta hydrolase, partial [Candidatus Eiseniibacteriota bacterium]
VRADEDRRIGCVVVWAGVGTFERFSSDEVRRWRERGEHEIVHGRTGQVFRLRTDFLDDLARHRTRYDLQRIVRRFRVPLLAVHGTDDETVPIGEIEELLAWAPPPTTRFEAVRGTGHTFGAVHPFAGVTPALERALTVTRTFLAEHLPA